MAHHHHTLHLHTMNKTIQTALDVAFRDITTFGGAIFYLTFVLVLFLVDQKNLSFTLLAGFISTLVITVIIRLLYFRERPRKQEFHNILERLDASSFPSLHAGRAVFLAGVGISYSPSLLFTLLCIVAGALIIYSRIHLKKHDWIDVLGGIVVGMGIYFGVLYWM